MNHNLQTLKVVLLALVLAAGIQYASAQAPWRSPTASPPGDNTYAPINVGGTAQSKAGGLIVGTGAGVNPGLVVENGNLEINNAGSLRIGMAGVGIVGLPPTRLDVNGRIMTTTGFCIGPSCINAWPTGGGGSGLNFYNNGAHNYSSSGINARGALNFAQDAGSPYVHIGLNSSYALPQGCSTNQVVKWNGSAWTCQADATGGGATGLAEVRFFCGPNQPSNHGVCPAGWTSGGTFDGEGQHWCYDAVGTFNGGVVGWRQGSGVEPVLCFR